MIVIKDFDTYIELENYTLSFSNHKFYVSAKNEIAEKELYLATNNDSIDAAVVENLLPYEDASTTQPKQCEWVSFSMSMGCSDFFAAFVFWQNFLMQKEPEYAKKFTQAFKGVSSVDYRD